ncbi:hypothetical protein GGR57DRAFT_518206, partial [Xylariaceae sp. FL1272]
IISLFQYASARRSARRLHELGHSNWTQRHAFFADMGGFIVKPVVGSPIPVTGAELAHLVGKGYMECPEISAGDIWDRSKVDLPAKVVMGLHITWFAVRLLSRVSAQLPITPLEIFTASIVLCSLGSMACWLSKPSDVRTRITIHARASRDEITQTCLEIGTELNQPYNPVFDIFQRASIHMGNALPYGEYPSLNLMHKVLFFMFGKGFAACHLMGWNAWFPTRGELVGWRIASLLLLGPPSCFWNLKSQIATWNSEAADAYPKPCTEEDSPTQHPSGNVRMGAGSRMKSATDITVRDWHYWKLLSRFLLVVLSASYVLARVFLLVEALVSLREQPSGVYLTFDITDLLTSSTPRLSTDVKHR